LKPASDKSTRWFRSSENMPGFGSSERPEFRNLSNLSRSEVLNSAIALDENLSEYQSSRMIRNKYSWSLRSTLNETLVPSAGLSFPVTKATRFRAYSPGRVPLPSVRHSFIRAFRSSSFLHRGKKASKNPCNSSSFLEPKKIA
jgi:hypothetical protein